MATSVDLEGFMLANRLPSSRRSANPGRTSNRGIGHSAVLFARPSFVSGAASAFDIGGTLIQFNDLLTSADADALAFQADWAALGDDFRDALAAIVDQTIVDG
jgi:hypothetical protein